MIKLPKLPKINLPKLPKKLEPIYLFIGIGILLIISLAISFIGITDVITSVALLFVLGWYEYNTYKVCTKSVGEVAKDEVVIFLWFLLIWVLLGRGILLPRLREFNLYMPGFPGWTSALVIALLFFATLRSAAESIRISKKGEKEDDKGLLYVKVTFEMLQWFLLFPVTAIFISSFLGIRWWNFIAGPAGIMVVGLALVWCFVWYQLPGTYSSSVKFMKRMVIFILIILSGISFYTRGGSTGVKWLPKSATAEKSIAKNITLQTMEVELQPHLEKMQEIGKKIVSPEISPEKRDLLSRELEGEKEKCREIRNKYAVIEEPTRQARVAVAQQQWQLCWEKKPGYEGKTGTRYKCLPAKIESRNESHIIISYSYSGGRGIQEGTSTDGISYDGAWSDSTGRGNWHLRFTSPNTAFGWSDDEGRGEKQPNVLEKT